MLLRRVGGRHCIDIVEAEEGRTETFEEVESIVHLQVRQLLGAELPWLPRATERTGTENVGARPGEAVPITDREPEMLFHRLAEDFALRIIVMEGEHIVGVGPLVADGVDV